MMTDAEPHEIAEFREQNGFAVAEESSPIWMATLGPLELPLPNFRWRREILAQHDLHHLMTGYDTSAKGELLVAAWETGIGCYDDWRAQGLCITLMVLGLVRYPVTTWRAFERGRNCR
tara:strand:+ start:23803 stop:24156 length:354 start_codon:yes stop_codon:yes gene_type:complete